MTAHARNLRVMLIDDFRTNRVRRTAAGCASRKWWLCWGLVLAHWSVRLVYA